MLCRSAMKCHPFLSNVGGDHSTNQGRVPGAFRPLVGHRKLQRTSLGIREGSLDKTTGFEHVESPVKSSCIFIIMMSLFPSFSNITSLSGDAWIDCTCYWLRVHSLDTWKTFRVFWTMLLKVYGPMVRHLLQATQCQWSSHPPDSVEHGVSRETHVITYAFVLIIYTCNTIYIYICLCIYI